ncbi:5'-methylthioadenosine/adenosylhomocysteine nucleosidase [uncultured Ilyobacter sp.]|uniref:5'-methylthioadenosine/adenosylhomocysteine nucleosidase n=1 Tax=uncultured Ilyobacter sp. TaxID=544433 RepID=UPI0029C7235D|nr:5'-methylthioadenosine/adenosylhomocysteine nucleosidase [uncultured Ilyobacter sp.]
MLIGIIGAMNEEIIELKEVMENIQEEKKVNLTFYRGKLNDKEVVLVECGIGKVNAAICTTLLIDHYKVDKIIFTGVAGGVNPDIEVGDIVVSTELIQHDFDTTAFGTDHGVIPRMENSVFRADETLKEIAEKVAVEKFGKEKVWTGRILSGDQFVASIDKIKWLRETFNGECTEMEGAAVAHVCYLFNTPFLILRSISDKANHDADVDFAEFVHLAAKNSKEILEGILDRI